jgi:hypothetical protein
MTVKKFRSVEDMEDTLWRERGPALFAAVRRVWGFATRTVSPRFPHGVYRHRSIEDMNAQDEKWAQANFEAFQARRTPRTSR